MGKGHTKRTDRKNRLVQWRDLVEELGSRFESGVSIPEPGQLVEEMHPDLSRGDRDQAIAVVRWFVEQRGARWVVLPSKLRPALTRLDELGNEPTEAEPEYEAAPAVPLSSARTPTPPPVPVPSVDLLISDICKLTLGEAAALLAECAGGRLPEVFSSKFKGEISSGAWRALTEHGLVVEVAQGDGVVYMPDAKRFEPVRFVLVDRHVPGEYWQVVPDVHREKRHEHMAWLTELRGYIERRSARLMREAEAKVLAELPLPVVIARLKVLVERVRHEAAEVCRSYETRIVGAGRMLADLHHVHDDARFERQIRALRAELRDLAALKASMPTLDEERLALEAAIERLSAPQRA